MANGVSSRVAAKEYAEKTGGKTLAMAITDAGIKLPDKVPPGPNKRAKSQRIWAPPSIKFAKQAQGDIHVFVGKKVNPLSVYSVHEKPLLLKNSKVTRVTEHHLDGTTNVIKGHK
jgi:hypothetical protein